MTDWTLAAVVLFTPMVVGLVGGFALGRLYARVKAMHASDCALHAGPAETPGPCDCGACRYCSCVVRMRDEGE